MNRSYVWDDIGHRGGGDDSEGEEARHWEDTLLSLYTDWGRGHHWNNNNDQSINLGNSEVSGPTFIFLLLSLSATEELTKFQVEQHRDS